STSTATTPLWDSGTHGNGFTFAHTFASAGSFPYKCVIHPLQVGTVTVSAISNLSLIIAISSPTNGATFAGPWTGSIQVATSDSDGSVSKVDFFAGTNLLGTVSNPGATASLSVSNLAASSYVLTAVATDNVGAGATSSPIAIQVLQPVPIVLGSPHY